MKFLPTASLAACLLLSAQGAHADITDSCNKFKTSYDKTYCVAKLFLESDNELNMVYTELRKPLKDNVKQQLTETQRDWIKYRNAACESSGSIDVGCNYKVNRERTEYLRDRARECKTGNCNDAAISKKSWE
ncbi:MAG TPA: hypothetical protein DHV01_08310 [Rhodoferax sp.]|uniref:lysozyme inhibitor LprI family protein n=1 Tax=Rhodoferax sp. TaxID=50421 RepID=UPI000AF90482|nr:lysozyme inhibitor LprI family protein [Rhodoferax sp.]HCX81595.1 hypothetical protein [Rhodoferax sp.]